MEEDYAEAEEEESESRFQMRPEIFRFVVHRLRWLARVPGLPQLFDAALLAWTWLAHPARLAAMQEIETRARALPGVRLRTHRLGGTEFARGPRELGHLHGNGLLDLHVGRAQRDALVAAGRAEPHHVFAESGWISFWVREKADAAAAAALLVLAADFSA